MAIYEKYAGANREIKRIFQGYAGANREIKQIATAFNGANRIVFKKQDGIDDYTKLMLHCEDFADSSFSHRTLTNNGVTIDNNGRFSKCIQSDEMSERLTVPYFALGNTFTVDWWEYGLGTPIDTTKSCIFGDIDTSVAGISLGESGVYLSCSSSGTSWDIFRKVPIKDRTNYTWVHWAFVKNGSSWKTYKNGKLFWSATSSLTIYGTGYPYGIGGIGSGGGSYLAKIDEFRISNVARWTSDFTPSTEPYS